MNNDLRAVAEYLKTASWVSIFSHVNPDGDAIGSSCALASALENIGVRADIYNVSPIPEVYHFLKKAQQIRLFTGDEELAPVVVVLDAANLKRAELDKYPHALADKTIVEIDHHLGNEYFGAYNYVNDQAIANCENVYQVLEAMAAPIDEEVATALYLGLSTDSGSFRFDAVTAETHRVAAKLLEKGARMDLVRLNIYESVSMAKLSLQRYLFAHMDFAAEGRIAWCALKADILAQTKAESNDIDGLVDILKNIEGVEIAILLRERADGIKASFRSKEWVNVNELAQKFSGGGHVRAAGATIRQPLAEAIDSVLKEATMSLGEQR